MSPRDLFIAARDPRRRRDPRVQHLLGIPNGGVIVPKSAVKNHRYLRRENLAHSPSIADVMLSRSRWKGPDVDVDGAVAAVAGFMRRARAMVAA